MSDAIETVNGISLAAFRSAPAWHNLGNVFAADENQSMGELLAAAHLTGWNLRTVNLADTIPGLEFVTPSFGVVRDNPINGNMECLSVRGDRYDIYAPEELGDLMSATLDSTGEYGGGLPESAGSLFDGRRVFMSIKLNHNIVIDGNDTVELYLMGATSFDGSLSTSLKVTPVRVVCQNTLSLALSGVGNALKVRHTKTQRDRLAMAREALGISFAYADAFEKEAATLYQTECTKDDFNKIIEGAFGKPSGALNAQTRAQNKIDKLQTLFAGGTNANITGTMWGALNTLTEFTDYYRTVRDGNDESMTAGAAGLDTIANANRDKFANVVRQAAIRKGAALV